MDDYENHGPLTSKRHATPKRRCTPRLKRLPPTWIYRDWNLKPTREWKMNPFQGKMNPWTKNLCQDVVVPIEHGDSPLCFFWVYWNVLPNGSRRLLLQQSNLESGFCFLSNWTLHQSTSSNRITTKTAQEINCSAQKASVLFDMFST